VIALPSLKNTPNADLAGASQRMIVAARELSTPVAIS